MQKSEFMTQNGKQYETVIGLEIHVQLATASKAFCSDAVRFGQEPNTHTSVISLAHPGTLPRLNRQQVNFATKLGLALGCRINSRNAFDRKNYFYADLPKGYQITQDKEPICLGGELEIKTSEGLKTIRIHHIHMEEDAGKSIHDQDPSVSFIDLNRAGTPLLEIVTQPDLRSGEEVDALMTAMRHLVRWLNISDGNMEEGSMRCDINISVREKGTTSFGTRCEVKNVNSMRFARQAIQYESNRQIQIVEAGGIIEQNTLNFDPNTGVTTPLRSKENAHDYRYFPDPDLPPVVLTPQYIAAIEADMPVLPAIARAELVKKFGLTEYDTQILAEERAVYNYTRHLFERIVSEDTPPSVQMPRYKAIANLIINKILPTVNEMKMGVSDFPLTAHQLGEFLTLIESDKISNSVAYQTLFPKMLAAVEGLSTEAASQVSATALAENLNLFQSADTDFLVQIVKDVLAKNPDKVLDYKKGKKGLIGFFMGEVMKASKGKAEPKATNSLIVKELEN
jgi:aspartyl-tRNA(Asn)/glutamyl-tRNA(Gln) amidotransferase subunit B